MKILKYSLIASFLLCFCSLKLFSQESDNNYYSSKHEVNIVIDNIFAKSIQYYYTYDPYYPYYPYNLYPDIYITEIGLGYKYHFSKSAIRSKISFGNNNQTTYNKSQYNHTKSENSITNISLFLGYEFHKNINRVQIFYGADISISSNQIKDKITYLEEQRNPDFEEYYYDNKREFTTINFSPLIGTRFFITPSLSISTEIKFIIESFNGKTYSINSQNWIETTTDVSGFKTKFGPLGSLSVNIHL